MTMTTPRGPESTVARMVANARHIQNIEVETGWTPDEAPLKRAGNYPTGPRLTHGASQSQIRDWARTQGLDVNPRGTVRRDIAEAYAAAHPQETP